jgi:hypothetical protein
MTPTLHLTGWYIAEDNPQAIRTAPTRSEGQTILITVRNSAQGTLTVAETKQVTTLAAASPDLLVALEDMVGQIKAFDQLHGVNSCAICPDAARAAIAKARGEARA